MIFAGLTLLGAGLFMVALTPAQPVPGYSQARLTDELTSRANRGESPATSGIPVPLPPDGDRGWAGLIWIAITMVPVSIGGGVLPATINSLITKSADVDERGGILGISAAFVSGSNAIAPVMGGALFSLVGMSAPFVVWGIMIVALLGFALAMVKPQPDETSAPAVPVAPAH